MKKVLFSLALVLIGLVGFSQHDLPYGGRVGDTNAVWIDSIALRNDTLVFYSSLGNEYYMLMSGEFPLGIIVGEGGNVVEIDSISQGSILFYNNSATELEVALTDTLALSKLVNLQSDTIPIAVFGGGGGQLADTALFSNTAMYGFYYYAGSDTLVVTSLKGILVRGSGVSSVGVQISWHATLLSGSATTLNSSPYTVSSIYIGDEDSAFANALIPPNVWIWCTTPTVTAGLKPSYLSVTLSGYKYNYEY